MSGAETGWLIEIRDASSRALWWTGPLGCWTVDAARAARYRSRSDAERVIPILGHDGAIAVECPQQQPPATPSKSWRAG